MIDRFENFILESKFEYFGNYNTIPVKGRENNFAIMLHMAKPVSKIEFMKNVNYNVKKPDIKFFKSIWDGKEVYYFVDDGVENIFIKNDAINL